MKIYLIDRDDDVGYTYDETHNIVAVSDTPENAKKLMIKLLGYDWRNAIHTKKKWLIEVNEKLKVTEIGIAHEKLEKVILVDYLAG